MSLGKRSICVWLPRLPVNRYGRSGVPVDSCLFAVTAEEKNAVRLISLNHHARRLGLRVGMTLADARAAAPELTTMPEDALRDEALLKALQRWTVKFTPWSACTGGDKLNLNITGCAHLFGGEHAMGKYIVQELTDLQIEARLGIADTKGAAQAAAQFGNDRITIIQPGETRTSLASYPIDALFTDEKIIFELKRLGIKRIGDLYTLKSADLARRFGFGLLRSYEKLLGVASDPVTPQITKPTFAARMSFPEPIGLRDDVNEALNRLTGQVCKRLIEHGFGTRGLQLTALRADKEIRHIEIGLSRVTQDAKPILGQFSLKLDKLDAGDGIDMLRLAAINVEPFKPIQKRFAEAEKQDALDELIATLGNHLGFDRVLRWAPVSSLMPLRSFRFVEAARHTRSDHWHVNRLRPLTLYDFEPITIIAQGRPPKEFLWRRVRYTAQRTRGPERIAPEWWRPHEGGELRDYWRVDTSQGPRLWLSTKPAQKPAMWDIAGVFP